MLALSNGIVAISGGESGPEPSCPLKELLAQVRGKGKEIGHSVYPVGWGLRQLLVQ